MDGVLVDSEYLHYEANKEMMKIYYDIDIEYTYYKQFIGGTIDNMWNIIKRDFSISDTKEELNSKTDKILFRMLNDSGYPAVAGVARFVKMLSDTTDLKLAVASSSYMSRIEKNLRDLGLSEQFQVKVSGQETGTSKPDPTVFLVAAERLGVKPSECLVIEDSTHGIHGAVNAGMVSLGYINKNSGDQDLSDADACFESFENLDMNFINMIYSHKCGEPVTVIETERLIIREITVEDVSSLYELYKDDEITKYMPALFENIDEEIEYTKQYINTVYKFYHYGMWLVILKGTGQIIGRVGFEYKENEETNIVHELGYMIGKNYQRKGYAYESLMAVISLAKESYDISELFVEVSENNIASIELAKKIGFIFDGKRNDKYLIGELKIR